MGAESAFLGTTLTDSGTTDRSVSFFHVPVIGNAARKPEPQEAISRVVHVTRDEHWAYIDSGMIRDAYTVQALALYERRLTTSESRAE